MTASSHIDRLIDIVRFDPYRYQPHNFKTHLLGRSFYSLRWHNFHSYKKCFVLSPTDISQFTPSPWGPTSSLAQAHHPMSNSDIICSRPSPPLTDFIRFGSLRIVVSLMVLKHIY